MRSLALAACLSLPLVVIACDAGDRAATSSSVQRFTCPMHPGYISEHAGDCPICGMKLVPVGGDGGTRATPRERRILHYRSPMNPSETSPTPLKDEMGMDYVPVYADEGAAAGTIDLGRRKLVGMTTVTVRRVPLGGDIRALGSVAIDERRVARVQPRFDGFIVKLRADFVGRPVRRGEVLASLYSPELLAAQNELLLAVRSRPELARTGLSDATQEARSKLRLAGMTAAQIALVEKRGKPLDAIDVVAPIGGVITAKSAIAGGRVGPSDVLFEITDLSRVWLLADVYESELPRLRLGQPATITFAFWPGRSWHGRVGFIFPSVDDKTRTVRVRVELPNERGELKPEMFADVTLAGRARAALAIPDDAVIDSGTRKLAFVALADGRLEPREIRTGERAGGLVEVRSGLAEGEQIASGAAFLLDSESRLQSALTGMSATPAPPTRRDASDGGTR